MRSRSAKNWKRLFGKKIRSLSEKEWKQLFTGMITHTTLTDWGRICAASPYKTHVVKLENCDTPGKIISAVGQVLRSKDSTPIDENSVLGGLSDVMYDFFYESWGHKKAIALRGFAGVAKLHPEFAIELIDALQFSFLSSIEMRQRLVPDSDVTQEIENTQIWIVWN